MGNGDAQAEGTVGTDGKCQLQQGTGTENGSSVAGL